MSGEGRVVEKKQAGFSDRNLLCLDCEKKFSGLDAYGWRILGDPDLSRPKFDHQFRHYGYIIRCDVDQLHKFILSVLWRASATRIAFYDKLCLGRYHQEVEKLIFSTAPVATDRYQTIIFRLSDDFLGEFSGTIFPPLADRLQDGALMCQLFLPKLKIVTFIGPAPVMQHWMKLSSPDSFIMPFLTAANNRLEWSFLERIHRNFHDGTHAS